jgi:putative membrane protein
MGIGAAVSFALFIAAFAYLFENYPLQAGALFFGLVAGGLPALWREANRGRGKFKAKYWIGILLAFAFAAYFGALGDEGSGAGANALAADAWYVCLAGLVAGLSSVVPGMSVSMLLMLLGVYAELLSTASGALANPVGAAAVLAPFVVCFFAGMALSAKLVKWVFGKHPTLAHFIVFGFMCGTLVAAVPLSLPPTLWEWLGCLLALAAGLGVSVLFEFLGKRFRADDGENANKTEIISNKL